MKNLQPRAMVRALPVRLAAALAVLTVTWGLTVGPAQAVTSFKVTVTRPAAEPRFGDDLLLTININDSSGAATQIFLDKPSGADPQLFADDLPSGNTTVAINTATAGLDPGMTHTLRVEASGELGSGTATTTVFPSWLVPKVKWTKNITTFPQALQVTIAADPVSQILAGGTIDVYPSGQPDNILATTTVINGVADIKGLHAQTNSVLLARYSGDSHFLPGSPEPATVTVRKLSSTTSLKLTRGTATQGDPVFATLNTDTADVSSPPSGVLTLRAVRAGDPGSGDELYRASVDSTNYKQFDMTRWVSGVTGDFNLIATFTPAGNDVAPSSATTTLGVLPSLTPVSFDVRAPIDIVYGGAEKLEVVVMAADGSPVSGQASLGPLDSFASSDVQTVDIVDDTAVFDLSDYEVGSHVLRVEYLGDSSHRRAGTQVTLHVLPAPTLLAVTAPPAVRAGSAFPIHVSSPRSKFTPVGAVVVEQAGIELGRVQLSAGSGVFTLPTLPSGPQSLTFRYLDSEGFAGSSNVLSVDVTAGSSDTGGGTGGSADGGAGASGGTGQPGGNSNQPGGGTTDPVPTRLVSQVGARGRVLNSGRARIAVVVRGAAPPTGRIFIKDGNRTIAKSTLKASSKGRAVLLTRRLTRGKHKLRVVYSGDSHLLPGRSRALTFKIV